MSLPESAARPAASDAPSITAARAPAFQFYPRDYLADAQVVMMSLEERGAYVHLLCHCWLEGALPDDESRLARLLGLSLARFRKLWPQLAPSFRAAPVPGFLLHPRLEAERAKQDAFRARQVANGRKGGRPRGNGNAAPNGKGLGFPGQSHDAARTKLCSLPSSPSGEEQRAAAPVARGSTSRDAALNAAVAFGRR